MIHRPAQARIFAFFLITQILPGFLMICDAQADEYIETVQPLDFFRNKPSLPDSLLKEKREGSYFTGFPDVGYNPDTEFSYGAIVQFYNNGVRESPFFAYTPYRRRIVVGGKDATRGVRRLFLDYDQPYIADLPWRLRARGLIRENQSENYYGLGEETLETLRFPGTSAKFQNYKEYDDALHVNRDGKTWKHFDDYQKNEKSVLVLAEYDLLGGLLRPQMGFHISHINTGDYTGDLADGAVIQETRLMRDFNMGKIIGFDGGWDNAFRIGLTYDTRDFEPDPSAGIVLQATGRISTEIIESSFDYQQFTFSARGFHNLLKDPKRLVLAGRLVYAMQFGDVPFYSAPLLPFTDGDKIGLGGFDTIRGFNESRFVGDAAIIANAELRWSFAQTTFLSQDLRFMLVPFFDTGRVFDSVGESSKLRDYKFSEGIGLCLAWNVSTIVSFIYSYSSENDYNVNMELGHQF